MSSYHSYWFFSPYVTLTQSHIDQFYSMLDSLGLRVRDGSIDLKLHDLMDHSIVFENPDGVSLWLTFSLRFNREQYYLRPHELAKLPPLRSVMLSFERFSKPEYDEEYIRAAVPILKGIHNVLPTFIGAPDFYDFPPLGLVKTLVQYDPKQLFAHTFWPRAVWERIGLEKVELLEDCTWELLDGGGLYIQIPIEFYHSDDDRYFQIWEKAERVLGLAGWKSRDERYKALLRED